MDAFGSTRRRKQLAGKEGAAVHEGAVGGAAAVRALLAAANEKAVAGAATKVCWRRDCHCTNIPGCSRKGCTGL